MGKRYALCIGINKYVNAKSINLRFARPDAEDLASILRNRLRGGFDQVQELLDEQATKVSIRQVIDNLLQSPLRQPDDLILLFFSGHGIRDKQGDLCLVPSDFCYHDDGSIDFTSFVHAKELEISIGNSDVQNIILLIDCCHSGALGRAVGRISLGDNTNLFVIGAARASEPALEIGTLKHGVFTECLLRALNLSPDKGEWITLGQIVTFIGEEIKKFQTSQLIQSTSRYVDLGIAVSRNPSYSILSTEFTDEIVRIFELAKYDIQPSSAWYSYPNLFVAKLKMGFRPSKIGVLCLDNNQVEVTDAHIQQFESLIRQLHAGYDIAEGMLVTCDNLPANMQRRIEALGITSCSTSKDLLRSLIDFGSYLRQLVDEFEQDGLHRPGEPAPVKYYIELEAETNDGKRWRGSAIDYVRRWLSEKGGLQLALLGEYGSGKTTFCKRLACDLAKEYLQAKHQRNHRIPIMISLNEFPRGQVDIEAFITGYLAGSCGVSNPSFKAFKAMNDAGFLLLILDGFDEMAVHTDADTIYANLMQIERLAASPNSRALLASRPEYFITGEEEQQALQPIGLLARHSKYKRLHLCGFDRKQIQSFLQKRIPLIPNVTEDWTYYYSEIKRIHDLSDLSSRPVLLEMITKTLPELVSQGKSINRSILYQTYLEGELQRQSIEKRRELLIKREDRLRMMQTVALHFYLENPHGLAADLIQVLVHDQMSPEQLEEFEAYTRDFLTCSFLMRQGDAYSFSHRSFVEYLAARALFEEIESTVPKFFGERKLTKEVSDFLVELQPNRSTLSHWIQSTAYETFETVRYLGANSMTILVRLGEDLSKSNFSGAVLNEADLGHGVFRGAIFAHASFNNVDLTGAVLDHCNFTKANLRNVKLVSAKVRDCDLREAYLDLTDLTGSDLKGSDLRGCICYGANFQDVLADNCKVTSLDGVLNPSSSLKLAVIDISGHWIEQVKSGYKSKLWIVKESADRISGKLNISAWTWIEFKGTLRGRYLLEGTEFIQEGFVVTKQFLSSVQSYEFPRLVLETLESWEGRVFSGQKKFLKRLESDLGGRSLEGWLDRKQRELDRLGKELDDKKEELEKVTGGYLRKNLRKEIDQLERKLDRCKEEFNRRESLVKELLDEDDNWYRKLVNHINFELLSLGAFTRPIRQHEGWLTLTPRDDDVLLLHLSSTSETTSFIRSSE